MDSGIISRSSSPTHSSPPYSPSRTSSSEDQTTIDGGASPAVRYQIALHSVRITKFGYTVDPLELRYAEIANQLSGPARRSSLISFDPSLVAHKILSLIRGFWSQPAFPKGKLVNHSEQISINATISEFKKNPTYPHKSTKALMTKGRVTRSKSKSSSRRSSSILKNLVSTDSDVTESRSSQSSKLGKNSYLAWIPKDKEPLAELITTLLVRMESLFSGEDRIIKVKAPCFVLGDIHGNLTDLRTYERSLWPKAPSSLTNNYLFLGDYVDRGEHSIECVLYLFCMKLIAPNKFFMLRGNHEVATIQRQYTFEKECEEKFGPIGKQLWKNFNRVFDLMPIAAIVDDQIFCAHGGIPKTIGDIKTLAAEIPSPLDNPEFQCPSAWEILWNDPITDSELISMVEMDNVGAASQSQIQAGLTLTENRSPPPQVSASTPVGPSDPETTKPARPSSGAQEEPVDSPVHSDMKREEEKKKDTASAPSDTSMSESDKVLARASTAALSFYMKPEDQKGPEEEQVTKQSKSKQDNDDSTLRSVPSDTSSIASTSPQQMISDGFVPNIKRGTAYLFSDQAINNFLKLNNLSHVIRAHEVIPTGFAFHGEGRVITIFSSSQYCGLNNQVACALVEGNRIRILRMDTGDAGE